MEGQCILCNGKVSLKRVIHQANEQRIIGVCALCVPSYLQGYCELCDTEINIELYGRHLEEKHNDTKILANLIQSKALSERDQKYGLSSPTT
jgi:hypothetical protein